AGGAPEARPRWWERGRVPLRFPLGALSRVLATAGGLVRPDRTRGQDRVVRAGPRPAQRRAAARSRGRDRACVRATSRRAPRPTAGRWRTVVTTEDDFQNALDAQPGDWQTRLVFADWLQDRSDPRAEGYRALGMNRIVPIAGVPGRPVRVAGWSLWGGGSGW